MMSSSPESDDCQLYTSTAKNFELKKKTLLAKRQELEKQLFNSVSECDYLITVDANDSPSETSFAHSDIDSDLSGANFSKSRTKGKRSRKSEGVTSNPKRVTRSSRRPKNVYGDSEDPVHGNRDIVILDDDEEFSNLHCKPIDFKQAYNSKTYNEGRRDISQISNLSEDIDDEELMENEDVTLSIEWNNGKGIAHRVLKLGKYQKFERVYKELAKLEDLPTDRVVLLRDFTSVSPEDTPSSLNLSLYAGMKAFVTQTRVEHTVPLIDKCSSEDKNIKGKEKKDAMVVKLQLETHKTLYFTISKDQKMVVLYKKCAEEIKCEENKIKITFDGEFLNPKDRVSDLDVDDGDLFHVHVKH